MPEDHYQTLELPRTASPSEVKRAYRRLARKHHPDFNPGDPSAEDRMEEINRAYEVLCDKHKRDEYDIYYRQNGHREEHKAPSKETFEDAARRAAALERLSPYEILRVSPKASHREVRDAFGKFVATYGEAALSNPAAALAYQHMKSAYYLLSNYERRRRYNAEHGLPEPPLPEDDEVDRRLGVMDGLGDLAWIVPVAIGVLLALLLLFTLFRPYWL
jgi:curved DNA-binding protein CbpA